jgi:predicted HTH transcriptional regulator
MSSFPSQEIPIDDILIENESEFLEYKSSMLTLTQKTNTLQEADYKKKEIQKEIPRVIVAFLNSKGGTVIVGVDDNRNIVGIEKDYEELSKKKDWDGWVLHFRNLLKKYIDDELVSQSLKLKQYTKNGKTIVRIDISESPKPIYFKDSNESHFYIRSFNSSEKLDTKYAIDYMDRKRELKINR